MSFWYDIDRWWRSHANLRTLYLLLLGQMVSFVLAMGSFTSSLVSSLGVDAPLTQSSFNYLALALVYGSILLCRRQKLQISWYWYLLLGLVDVQGNYLVNKAYQYSSLTSVTLLDCWTVAWVIALTWFFLRTRYSLWQLLGAAICVLGLGLVLLSDAGVGGGGDIISFSSNYFNISVFIIMIIDLLLALFYFFLGFRVYKWKNYRFIKDNPGKKTH